MCVCVSPVPMQDPSPAQQVQVATHGRLSIQISINAAKPTTIPHRKRTRPCRVGGESLGRLVGERKDNKRKDQTWGKKRTNTPLANFATTTREAPPQKNRKSRKAPRAEEKKRQQRRAAEQKKNNNRTPCDGVCACALPSLSALFLALPAETLLSFSLCSFPNPKQTHKCQISFRAEDRRCAP